MKQTFLKEIFLLSFLTFFFVACCDNDKTLPIMLSGHEGNELYLVHNGEYHYIVWGGEGGYEAISSNPDVVKVEMVSDTELTLSALTVGDATVTVTDKEDNKLVLAVKVQYTTWEFPINENSMLLKAESLDEEQKEKIRKEVLATIPVQPGGGYKLVFSNAEEEGGVMMIYPEKYGEKGVEKTFRYKVEKVDQGEYTGLQHRFEFEMDGEIRSFFIERYVYGSTRDMVITLSLQEDLTERIQESYPEVEAVWSQQKIGELK